MRKEYMYMLEEVKGMSTPFMLELKPVSCPLWVVRIERRSFARKKKNATEESLQPRSQCWWLGLL